MTQDARSELGIPGTLRAGINLSNTLLVSGTGPGGDPDGVAPEIAAAIAAEHGVSVAFVTYPTPGEVADAVARDEWDIALIAEDPERAETIGFCDAYVEIEATYLVQGDSPFQSIADVDQPGVKIAVSARSAYDLYLARALKHAELSRAKGLPGAMDLFVREKLDALAGLVPALQDCAKDLPGSRIIGGHYTTVRQAVGTKPGNTALIGAVNRFLAASRENGLIAALIEKHGVSGKVQVASAA